MFSQSGTCSQSVKLPPQACAPHSRMWPARLPPASLSKSFGFQPNSWMQAPSVTALSTQRPVMTMSAPLSQRLGDREARRDRR